MVMFSSTSHNVFTAIDDINFDVYSWEPKIFAVRILEQNICMRVVYSRSRNSFYVNYRRQLRVKIILLIDIYQKYNILFYILVRLFSYKWANNPYTKLSFMKHIYFLHKIKWSSDYLSSMRYTLLKQHIHIARNILFLYSNLGF